MSNYCYNKEKKGIMKKYKHTKIISMKRLRMKAHTKLYLHLAGYKHLRDQIKIPLLKFKKK